MCFLSLRERHVSSQFDDFSQRIHPSFTNVHRLIASRSLCSLCALILPRQTPFHFHLITQIDLITISVFDPRVRFSRVRSCLSAQQCRALIMIKHAPN